MPEQKPTLTGGIEGKMDGVGAFYLVMSIIAMVLIFIESTGEPIQKLGLSYFWIGLGIGVLAQGIIAWILFRAGGEIIRLLKKLNGIPYGGAISEAKSPSMSAREEDDYVCTNCNSKISKDAKFCPNCGVEFEE